jgi:hypothetical protein
VSRASVVVSHLLSDATGAARFFGFTVNLNQPLSIVNSWLWRRHAGRVGLSSTELSRKVLSKHLMIPRAMFTLARANETAMAAIDYAINLGSNEPSERRWCTLHLAAYRAAAMARR